jgi:hypothetical protein
MPRHAAVLRYRPQSIASAASGLDPPDPYLRIVRWPTFAATHPAHVTLRVRPDVPSLRTVRLVREIERSLADACDRGDFRLVHYSLQGTTCTSSSSRRIGRHWHVE